MARQVVLVFRLEDLFLDLSSRYFASGRFSNAALFVGPPSLSTEVVRVSSPNFHFRIIQRSLIWGILRCSFAAKPIFSSKFAGDGFKSTRCLNLVTFDRV
uniref:Uncharacterized protein n=1 Tax=Proboscia inermis TaxID=420281 RepID=A0A6T8MTF0_9STRA